ncbi:hypothetical protein [Haloechinothrix halophila]|uniref:Uncharacterized protein n=1 Tax=Haloechinothrix halophila YIM 93223 TaxID=592678 RepID=W9DRS8_9PSEU|nr:hypothetical protein [Haloechinothrix halophila]ETA66377.1 hypothetical protein AmyhaDRAFT_0131 [Haloechinothrix halophila YIM 93223]
MSTQYAEHVNPNTFSVIFDGARYDANCSTDLGKLFITTATDANMARSQLLDTLRQVATVASQRLESLEGGWDTGTQPLQGYERDINEKAARYELLAKQVRRLAKIAGIEPVTDEDKRDRQERMDHAVTTDVYRTEYIEESGE